MLLNERKEKFLFSFVQWIMCCIRQILHRAIFCDRYAFAIKIQENQRIRKKRTSLTEKKRGRIQRKNESCSVINFVFRIAGPKKKKHSANTRRFQDECDEEKENAAECKLLVVISLIYLE